MLLTLEINKKLTSRWRIDENNSEDGITPCSKTCDTFVNLWHLTIKFCNMRHSFIGTTFRLSSRAYCLHPNMTLTKLWESQASLVYTIWEHVPNFIGVQYITCHRNIPVTCCSWTKAERHRGRGFAAIRWDHVLPVGRKERRDSEGVFLQLSDEITYILCVCKVERRWGDVSAINQ